METKDFQVKLLEEFSVTLLQDLINAYKSNVEGKRTGKGTSFLMKSLETKIVNDTKMRLMFESYGKFIEFETKNAKMPVAFEYKNKKHGLKTWVKNNLNKFDYVPGYKGKSISEVPQNIAIDRLAWGVAKGMQKGAKPKSMRWYSDVIWDSIAKLKEDIAEGYIEHANALMLKI